MLGLAYSVMLLTWSMVAGGQLHIAAEILLPCSMQHQAFGTSAARVPLRYSKVSIPEPLMDRLAAILEEHPELGYRSPTEAATRAVQKEVEALEARYGIWPPREETENRGTAALRGLGAAVERGRKERRD